MKELLDTIEWLNNQLEKADWRMKIIIKTQIEELERRIK